MSCTRGCCPTSRDHYRSLHFSHGPTSSDLIERRWSRDMPAYRALRLQGLQPPRIDGCAELASRATTDFEIRTGRILPKKEACETMFMLADSSVTL